MSGGREVGKLNTEVSGDMTMAPVAVSKAIEDGESVIEGLAVEVVEDGKSVVEGLEVEVVEDGKSVIEGLAVKVALGLELGRRLEAEADVEVGRLLLSVGDIVGKLMVDRSIVRTRNVCDCDARVACPSSSLSRRRNASPETIEN